MTIKKTDIKSPEGKLGIVMPGLGAISSTVIAGVYLIRRGMHKPIGSLTQMGKLRVGKGIDAQDMNIKDFIPLAALEDIEFGGWDIFEDNIYESAKNAAVLSREDIDPIKDELSKIKPWKAVFKNEYCKNLNGKWVKDAPTLWDLAQMVKDDILNFQKEKNCSRIVMIWCASTEIYQEMIHLSLPTPSA